MFKSRIVLENVIESSFFFSNIQINNNQTRLREKYDFTTKKKIEQFALPGTPSIPD